MGFLPNRLVDGPNEVVLGWRTGEEVMWALHPHSLSRRKTMAAEFPGYTFSKDNVGKVGRN